MISRGTTRTCWTGRRTLAIVICSPGRRGQQSLRGALVRKRHMNLPPLQRVTTPGPRPVHPPRSMVGLGKLRATRSAAAAAKESGEPGRCDSIRELVWEPTCPITDMLKSHALGSPQQFRMESESGKGHTFLCAFPGHMTPAQRSGVTALLPAGLSEGD